MTLLSDERRLFHKTLVDRGVLTLNAQGVASIADSSQRTSKIIAGSRNRSDAAGSTGAFIPD